MPSKQKTRGRTTGPAAHGEGDTGALTDAARCTERVPLVALLLAAAWIIVTAVQYVGADQRMRMLLGEPVPLPGLALVDLTAIYVLLLAGTIIYAALRALRARKDNATP